MADGLHCDACRAIFDPELWPTCPNCGAANEALPVPDMRAIANTIANCHVAESTAADWAMTMLMAVSDADWQRIKTWRDAFARREQSDGSR